MPPTVEKVLEIRDRMQEQFPDTFDVELFNMAVRESGIFSEVSDTEFAGLVGVEAAKEVGAAVANPVTGFVRSMGKLDQAVGEALQVDDPNPTGIDRLRQNFGEVVQGIGLSAEETDLPELFCHGRPD